MLTWEARHSLRAGSADARNLCRMISAEYTRSTGRNLTYRICADEWGAYKIYLGDRELLSGRDGLAAHGSHRAPNKRKAPTTKS